MKINEIQAGTQVSMSFIINGKDIRVFGEVVENDMMKDLFGILSDFEAAIVPACIVRVGDTSVFQKDTDYVADTLLAPKECVTYLWECVDGRRQVLQDQLLATIHGVIDIFGVQILGQGAPKAVHHEPVHAA